MNRSRRLLRLREMHHALGRTRRISPRKPWHPPKCIDITAEYYAQGEQGE